MTEKRAQRFVDQELKAAADIRRMGLPGGKTNRPATIVKKMRAIGMKPR